MYLLSDNGGDYFLVSLISLGHRPRSAGDALSKARDGLEEWYQNLEPELRYHGHSNVEFWVKALHIFYK